MEWKVQSLNGDPVIVQKDNTPVAFMAWGQPLSKAQLISAAPDLYELVKAIAEMKVMPISYTELAKNIVAKVEGK